MDDKQFLFMADVFQVCCRNSLPNSSWDGGAIVPRVPYDFQHSILRYPPHADTFDYKLATILFASFIAIGIRYDSRLVNCCFVVVAAVVVFILPTNMTTNGMHSFILNLMRNLPCKGLLSCNIGVMDDANSCTTPPITPPRYLIFYFFYVCYAGCWMSCKRKFTYNSKSIIG